jgi:hypothetical protein
MFVVQVSSRIEDDSWGPVDGVVVDTEVLELAKIGKV